MKKEFLAVALLGLACLQAQAVNKCTDASGKVAFQDAPCTTGKSEQIKTTPASGYGEVPSEQGASSAPARKQSGAEKMVESLKDERTRRAQWVVMNDARTRLAATQAQCDQEQARLAASKASSNNNLAGATRDVSIAQQMTAAATACAAKTRSAERDVDAAEKLCADIQCIPAF